MTGQQLTLFPSDGRSTKPLTNDEFVSSIWSFPESSNNQIYRWYGSLPRPLVERLLKMYCRKGSIVLDPFMGLGTTLDVAADLNLRAVGVDTNPLACFIAETRLEGQPTRAEINGALMSLTRRTAKTGSASRDAGESLSLIESEKYDYTRKWFAKKNLDSILTLLSAISDIEEERTQRFLFVLAAQAIRDVASVDARCTHHLVTKKKSFVDPLAVLRKGAEKCIGFCRTSPVNSERIFIRQGSALNLGAEVSHVNLALIHPPYLGMIHYHLIHRLATDLLDIVKSTTHPPTLMKYDFDYERIKKFDVSTDSSAEYRQFIERLSGEMEKVVEHDGRSVVIIGDQRYKGHIRHPFSDFIALMEDSGHLLEDVFIWVLQNNAGMHILRRGNYIDHNYILVFHRE